MKLTDIAPLNRWLALEQKINERSGLNASVFNVEGVRLTDFKRWANKLCPLIKADEKGQNYICAAAHIYWAMVKSIRLWSTKRLGLQKSS